MNKTQGKILLREAYDVLSMCVYRNLQLVENLDSGRLSWADTYLKNVEDRIRETKELLSGILLPAEKCKWIQCGNGDDGDYETECDNYFILDTQTDGMDFCIYCGKEIEFCLDEPEDDEPEAA